MNVFPDQSAGPMQVIVVDDVEGAADSFAQLIAERTTLIVGATRFPSEAMAAVRDHPVLVAVLDQILDQIPEPTTGTAVYQQLRRVSSDVVGVMLSAEAKLGDAGEANRLGYEDILDKAQVEQLPGTVRNIYFRQLARVIGEASVPAREVVPYRRRLGLRHRPSISLVSLDLLDAEFTADGDWKTYLQVSAGQTESKEVVLSFQKRVQLSRESKAVVKSSLGAKVAGLLEAQLEGGAEEALREIVDLTTALTKRIVVTHSLPQPEQIDAEYVRARNYQYAPVFRRLRGVLLASCRECTGRSLHVVEVLAATGRYASRHVDILASGGQQVVLTSTGL